MIEGIPATNSETDRWEVQENAFTFEFTVKLATSPTGPVAVGWESAVVNDAGGNYVPNQEVILDETNWDSGASAKLTISQDTNALNTDLDITASVVQMEGERECQLKYSGSPPPIIYLRVIDNDEAEVVVTSLDQLGSDQPPGTDIWLFGGQRKDYILELRAQPLSSVTVRVKIEGDPDLRLLDTNGNRVNELDLVFQNNDWQTRQRISVEFLEDSDASEGMATISHIIQPVSSSEYLNATIRSVVVSEREAVPGIVISSGIDSMMPLRVGVPGGGEGPKTYTVKLSSEPSAPVTVELESSQEETRI